MKQITIFFTMLATGFASTGLTESRNTILVPAFVRQYHYVLNETVFQGSDKFYGIVGFCIPSFVGEYGVWVTIEKKVYSIHYVRATKNVWSHKGIDWGNKESWGKLNQIIYEIGKSKLVERYERQIDTEICEKLIKVWKNMISEKTEDKEKTGFDGARYTFGYDEYDQAPIFRDTWNPDNGTTAAELCKIVNLLRDFVIKNDPAILSEYLEKIGRTSRGRQPAHGVAIDNKATG